ncbi:MAG: pyridoxamine 5'-phosphate oxidase family protein [Dehalococcoidia bacterium]|nr:pyridoxamine 5'-phosphate oxidase family protein [Dehalococcoidia bacterium]
MEIGDNWTTIRKVFDEAYKSCFHFAVASVNSDGSPHITPIGGLFLRDDHSGFYFEEFPSRLPENLNHNKRVCILAVNADKMFWGKSLMDGKFSSPPGVRLTGIVGDLSEASTEESALWQKKVGFARAMKGYKIIWQDMRHVRDIKFDSFEPVHLVEMTDGLV